MSVSAIRRLRFVGNVEGVSYLVLIVIAVLKRTVVELPTTMKVCGWTHGVLFVLYCVVLLRAMLALRWGLGIGAILFLASLVPCGTFVTDRWLRRRELELDDGPGPFPPATGGEGQRLLDLDDRSLPPGSVGLSKPRVGAD